MCRYAKISMKTSIKKDSLLDIILSGFSTNYFYVKIFALGRSLSLYFVTRMRNRYLNTGLKLLLKISPILVFGPPVLLGHAYALKVDLC